MKKSEKNNKKVLLLTPTFYPDKTGAAKYYDNYFQYLDGKIDLYVLTKKSSVLKKESKKIMREIPVFYNNILRLTITPLFTLFKIVTLHLKFKFDFIHVHSSSILAFSAGVFSLIFRVPIIYDVLDMQTPPILLKIGRVHKYLATGNVVKEKLSTIRLPKEKILCFKPPRNSFKPCMVKKKNDVVFVGEVNKKIKGTDILLNAFNIIINEKRQNIKLLVVGDGPDMDESKKFIKQKKLDKNVSFLGSQPYKKTLDYISRSKILVLPSRTEATPRVIIEAFELGTPVIGSDIKAISYMINDNQNGILFKDGNCLDLANKIVNLKKNEILQQKIRENALAKVKEYPTWKELSDKLMKVYTN